MRKLLLACVLLLAAQASGPLAAPVIDCDLRGCARQDAERHQGAGEQRQAHKRHADRAVRADARMEALDGRQGGMGCGRCPGRPGLPWCGCWLMCRLGLNDRDLWIARNWARKFARAGGPAVGRIVVWRHHVGLITGVGERPGEWLVLSGNDGKAVRERLRSVHGAIAFVTAGRG